MWHVPITSHRFYLQPPPSAAGQSSANGSVDLLGDVFSSPVTSQPAGSNSQPAANALFDDFDPRSSESGANGDFGDFSSAFSTGTTAPAMLSSGYVNRITSNAKKKRAHIMSTFSFVGGCQFI